MATACPGVTASGQATSPKIDVRAVAEVENVSIEEGRETVRLAPANRVVPGDRVIYTLEIRNLGVTDAVAAVIAQPIPNHMAYLADSATGPGTEITYSADGGATFERPEALQAMGPDGRLHVVNAMEYTHIRWQFKNILKAKSVAFAHFRAVVK